MALNLYIYLQGMCVFMTLVYQSGEELGTAEVKQESQEYAGGKRRSQAENLGLCGSHSTNRDKHSRELAPVYFTPHSSPAKSLSG